MVHYLNKARFKVYRYGANTVTIQHLPSKKNHYIDNGRIELQHCTMKKKDKYIKTRKIFFLHAV